MVLVNAELLDTFARPKILRNKKLFGYFREEYTNAQCKGCRKDLEINDKIYIFRHNTFVHTDLNCIRDLNKYIITKDLKALL